jgi:hypothetical protein
MEHIIIWSSELHNAHNNARTVNIKLIQQIIVGYVSKIVKLAIYFQPIAVHVAILKLCRFFSGTIGNVL